MPTQPQRRAAATLQACGLAPPHSHRVHCAVHGLLNLPLDDAAEHVQQRLVQPVSAVAVDGQVQRAKAHGRAHGHQLGHAILLVAHLRA
jgi:hypothetical protein